MSNRVIGLRALKALQVANAGEQGYICCPMTTGHWIVVRSKPHREAWAAENIQRYSQQLLGSAYPVYIPQCKIGLKVEPLFRSFVFVLMDKAWYFIRDCWGVAHIIMREGTPAPMPVREMHRMRRMENKKGFIELTPHRLFAVDQSVTINKGVLAERQGTCVGYDADNRVRVLLKFLGGEREFLFAETALR